MNDTNLLYLVYGMCIMFHLMMGWVFCCRKQGLAKKLIGLLMLLVAVQYAKDLVFLPDFYEADPVMERIASSIDIVTVPLYVLILIEFCRPGWLSKMRAFLLETPILAQWKFSGDKHKSLQVDTERTFHQRYPLVML